MPGLEPTIAQGALASHTRRRARSPSGWENGVGVEREARSARAEGGGARAKWGHAGRLGLGRGTNVERTG